MYMHDVRKKPGRKKNPRPTLKQEAYAKAFVKTGSRIKAKEEAGYVQSSKPDESEAVKFLIDKYRHEMEKKFIKDAEQMYENMKTLALTSDSDNVRFNATKDILDRAGLAPVSKSEIESRKFISADSRITRDLVERYRKEKGVQEKADCVREDSSTEK